MVYFKTNKANQQEKKAIILPYINDNFIQFNVRKNIIQHCIF